ncbi:hypothetical protein V8G54_029939 [Vigna mungo]|uniref:Uncharacterized protein n=1 Tax=Vigna mungo TaxID=3915 RepID=A0AAQ3RJM4_VIGMU
MTVHGFPLAAAIIVTYLWRGAEVEIHQSRVQIAAAVRFTHWWIDSSCRSRSVGVVSVVVAAVVSVVVVVVPFFTRQNESCRLHQLQAEPQLVGFNVGESGDRPFEEEVRG